MASDVEVDRIVERIQRSEKVMILSGAGMSTAAGIPDFRSPDGLYGSTARLLQQFTFTGNAMQKASQRSALESQGMTHALTFKFFRDNPIVYHEMRRGMIIGLGENQWKYTLGHVFPELLNRKNKLHLLASQNIDGLDHKVLTDKSKLFNPHGLMSTLVSESPSGEQVILCDNVNDPIYRKYVNLVKANIKDIYRGLTARKGSSSQRWPGPNESHEITLTMLGKVLPQSRDVWNALDAEKQGCFTVKPGSVLFDRGLWTRTAAGARCDWDRAASTCDCMMVMGTSLSGLSIDKAAHIAGRMGISRIVFDRTDAPKRSLSGSWNDNTDCFCQGSLDLNILRILKKLDWLEQIYDKQTGFLDELCLSSLETLRDFIQVDVDKAVMERVNTAIEAEIQREKRFYPDE